MVKNSILNITVAALGFTALATQPAFAVKNYSFGNAPNQVACSQVAGPNEFKRIAPQDSPTTAVKVCYITNTEAFWPTRYNVDGGYLYLVRGVAYRVKELSESGCDNTPSVKREMIPLGTLSTELPELSSNANSPFSFTPIQVAGLDDSSSVTNSNRYKVTTTYPCSGETNITFEGGDFDEK